MTFLKRNKYFKQTGFLFAVAFGALFLAGSGFAQEFSGTSFKVFDPVIAPGGYATSTSFRLSNVLYQIGLGTSTSASFKGSSGFLAFPLVTTPIVSATDGQDAQVPLSWSAAVGYAGWIVGGYSVGQSTVSGGPYSYTAVGAVTSYTATSLSNGTPYYFIIRVKDGLGNTIATSSQASATPVASTPPPGGGGGGGGGG